MLIPNCACENRVSQQKTYAHSHLVFLFSVYYRVTPKTFTRFSNNVGD
jgi:hypothetical protein